MKMSLSRRLQINCIAITTYFGILGSSLSYILSYQSLKFLRFGFSFTYFEVQVLCVFSFFSFLEILLDFLKLFSIVTRSSEFCSYFPECSEMKQFPILLTCLLSYCCYTFHNSYLVKTYLAKDLIYKCTFQQRCFTSQYYLCLYSGI